MNTIFCLITNQQETEEQVGVDSPKGEDIGNSDVDNLMEEVRVLAASLLE